LSSSDGDRIGTAFGLDAIADLTTTSKHCDSVTKSATSPIA
jgi:hypothetical protein